MNSKVKKQGIMCITILYIFLGALFIFGTFNDLEVDKFMLHYSNKFGIFMEDFGMTPQYTIQLFAYSMLIVSYHKIDYAFDIASRLLPFFRYLQNNKITYKILYVLYHIMYGAFFYGAFQGSNELLNNLIWSAYRQNIFDLLGNKPWVSVLWTGMRIALVAIVIFLLSKTDKKYRRVLEYMAIAGLAMYYGSNIINTLKAHFNRVRFREMIAYSHGLINENGMSHRGDSDIPREWIATTDFSCFDRWYKVGRDMGIYSEPTSFPSGHTSASSFSLLLIPLFYKSKSLNKLFIPAFTVGAGYMIVMGITRLLRGAHYLTDVTGAALIMLTMLLMICGVMDLLCKRAYPSDLRDFD